MRWTINWYEWSFHEHLSFIAPTFLLQTTRKKCKTMDQYILHVIVVINIWCNIYKHIKQQTICIIDIRFYRRHYTNMFRVIRITNWEWTTFFNCIDYTSKFFILYSDDSTVVLIYRYSYARSSAIFKALYSNWLFFYTSLPIPIIN